MFETRSYDDKNWFSILCRISKRCFQFVPLRLRLHFAGEATCRAHPATMHGAFLSGLREAAVISAGHGSRLPLAPHE